VRLQESRKTQRGNAPTHDKAALGGALPVPARLQEKRNKEGAAIENVTMNHFQGARPWPASLKRRKIVREDSEESDPSWKEIKSVT
jgi:hypothetical protein